MTENSPTTLGAADIQVILKALPHRFPFLLVDKVIDINSDQSATGIKNVTMNEPHFTGHFPERPIMPGVLIVEAMAQTAGIITILSRKETTPSVVYFMTIDNAKFRKPVVPGDCLHIHVNKLKQRGAISKYGCVAEVDGVKVAEAELAAMIASAEEAE